MEKIPRVTAHLRQLGFVRIDGLICTSVHGVRRIIARKPGEDYRFNGDHGWFVMELPNGEVWLASTLVEIPEFIKIMTDCRSGADIPLFYGESVCTLDLMARVADPEWMPNYLDSDMGRAAGF